MSAELNRKIAADFVRRAEALGLKGKRRDDAGIDFLSGAFSALAALNGERNADAQHLGAVTAWLVCTRGFSEIKRLAELEPEAKE